MTGNAHPTKRCDTCEFWARGDQWEFNEERHVDDRTAACHRNAPRPTLGDFEYELIKLVAIIAGRDVSEKEWNSWDWEESMLHVSSWPATTGSDWCGEWQQDSR